MRTGSVPRIRPRDPSLEPHAVEIYPLKTERNHLAQSRSKSRRLSRIRAVRLLKRAPFRGCGPVAYSLRREGINAPEDLVSCNRMSFRR